MSTKSYLAVVLHAHLPFVRHPEKDWYLEEDWFFEAITETYIPLILMIERLAKENIRPALTISLSPTLCAMLEDEFLEKRCRAYIEARLTLIEEELGRQPEGSPFRKTALMYQNMFEQSLRLMDRYSGDMITPFKQFQQSGLVEIITSSATHAVLPIQPHAETVRAQIAVAAEDYQERFSKKTKGLWLPECAYDPKAGQYLQLSGLKYFFMENHAAANASPVPVNGVFAPIKVRGGLIAFARDGESAKEVWSSQFGYPGDGAYREFYRDLGFDADYEYIQPYLHADGVRRGLGIKYHRVTGKVELADKQPYDPDVASLTAKMHAADFLKKRMAQADKIAAEKNIRPLITGTYDAELFGHWWFEGPQFLEHMIRTIRQERMPIQMVTASEAMELSTDQTEVEPDASSWGEGGYFEPWINAANDWIYPKINACAEKMIELANRYQYSDLTLLQKRLLNQAARELLLAQSSDWAFLLYVGSHAEYAEKRIVEHCHNFYQLARMMQSAQLDEQRIKELETEHNIFPNIDFRVFASASTF